MSENITVETAYLDAHNAIVRPEQVFAVSRYFLRYWLPNLTPAKAWLIVELRQQAYWAGGRAFQVSQDALARGAAVTERYVSQILNDDLEQFVDWTHETKYLSDYNRNGYDKNKYIVFADEPLAAIHVAGLMSLFTNNVENVVDTLRELIDADADALLERIEVAAGGNDSLPAATGQLLTVADVFAAATGQQARGDAARLCSKLQRKIIAAPGRDVVLTQYFRREWVRRLGHALAWLVVVARSHCFDDGKTVRDTLVIEKSVLAGEIGQSTRNLMRLPGRKHADEFIRVDNKKSTRHTLMLHVKTWQSHGEVLTPDDQVQWESMLDAGIEVEKCSDGKRGEPDKCSDGKRGEPDKCSEQVLDKSSDGKRGEPDKCSEQVLDKSSERLNTINTGKTTNTTTTPGGGEGGGDDDDVFLTDDERRRAIIALGINAASEFASTQELTPAALELFRVYMRSTNAGPGAVVKMWRAGVFTPPGSSSRPALIDLTPAADAPAPGNHISANGKARLAARLAKRANGATQPTNLTTD